MTTGIVTTNTNSITIGASGNNRIVLAIGTKSGTFDSTVTFDGAAPTGSLLNEPTTSQSAIYYWLEADLPATAGTYTYADNDILSEFLLYAEGVTQGAPTQSLDLTNIGTGGGSGSDTERILTLTSGSADDLRVFAMRNAGTKGSSTIAGTTLVDTGNANSIAGYSTTDNIVGFTASLDPSSAVALLFPTAAATSETATTGNIPLVIQAGYTLVDLVDPVTTNASLLFGVTGDTPVTGDDLEYDVTSVLDSGVSLSVAASGVWTVTEAVDGDWVTDITVSRRVVQADGTIGTEAVLTLEAPTGTVTSLATSENEKLIGHFRSVTGLSTYSLNELAIAYYKQVGSTSAPQFNDALNAAQNAVPFKGLSPTDWRN